MSSLSGRRVCGWSKFCQNDGPFYLERCPAWLPLLYRGGSWSSVCMSCLEAQHWCHVGLRVGLKVSTEVACLALVSFCPKAVTEAGIGSASSLVFHCWYVAYFRQKVLPCCLNRTVHQVLLEDWGTEGVEATLQQPEQKTPHQQHVWRWKK